MVVETKTCLFYFLINCYQLIVYFYGSMIFSDRKSKVLTILIHFPDEDQERIVETKTGILPSFSRSVGSLFVYLTLTGKVKGLGILLNKFSFYSLITC